VILLRTVPAVLRGTGARWRQRPPGGGL